MSTPFSGNATLASGNGTRLLANSTLRWANGTTLTNGTSPVYFSNYLLVTAAANNANVAHVPAGNVSLAANVSVTMSVPGVANVPWTIPPSLIADAVGGSLSIGDANQTYFATSAQTTVWFEGW